MIILFILGILLGAVAVFFALENVAVVTVTLFSRSITSPLSIIVLLAILSGVLIALLLFLPESLNNYFRYKKLIKENHRLEEELRKQKELTVFAKNTHPTHDEILHIEDGASEPHS
ncbi:MAG TPA: LapA family protein [Candidatus Paceibacterota bacterium]